LQGGMHQFFGAADGAADAMALGRAAGGGAPYLGLSGAAGLELGSQAVGAGAGQYGAFREGGEQLQLPSLDLGGEQVLVGDSADVGDFEYNPSEAQAPTANYP
ncbi:hypothetical protein, partial [Streptomyces sp. SBT349]|uniref:hypothetical protein n=1 Tax=Streptomyces sp. SBT349 TaxID=1580539 RepID=UPI00066CDA09